MVCPLLLAASTVGSTDGDVLMRAGNAYRQVGSDVIAVYGDIDIAAKTVDIVEARETMRSTYETKSKQSGLTIAITSPVISAIQTVQQMSQAASDTKDSRIQLLAAANIGLAANNAYGAVMAGQGTTINGKENQIATKTDDAGKVLESRDATAADKVGGIDLSISIGGSKSSSQTTQTSVTAAGSRLSAGNDIRISATGAGTDSDITVQGSNLQAGNAITLKADDEIKLLAAQNIADQHSNNKNSSASIGFSIGSNGFMVNVGASAGRGNADGADTWWTNTHLDAGNRISLDSGGDTSLIGAVARADQITAKVGGNLVLESLQDLSAYDSKQKSAGFSLSVGAGMIGGSLSLAKSKIESDYASVTEQTGIKAGDGGFDVSVHGDTDLTGAVITSTQSAIDTNQNGFTTSGTLTLSDLQNKAAYSAKATSVNLGSSMSFDGKLVPGGTGVGFGSDKGEASSTTLAAISGLAGNTAARTGDVETGIQKIFDAQKVQREIDAQTKITQMFNQLAPKAAADYASSQFSTLKNQAEAEADPAKRTELLSEASRWAPNGSYNIAMNIIIGAAGGALNSSITKETLSWAANEMRQNMIKDSEKFKGLCVSKNDCISNMTGESVGVNGDGKKIAGGRIVLETWCSKGGENSCQRDSTTTSGYLENSDGTVVFKPQDAAGRPLAISEFIEQHPEIRSELGGVQGDEGQMKILGFQFEYAANSFWDKLAEAYAGAHDTLNSVVWYDELGNGKNLDRTLIGQVGNITNSTNVIAATPFALSVLLPPEVWNAVFSAIKLK